MHTIIEDIICVYTYVYMSNYTKYISIYLSVFFVCNRLHLQKNC